MSASHTILLNMDKATLQMMLDTMQTSLEQNLRKSMDESLKPLNERMEKVESSVTSIEDRFVRLEEEVSSLKNKVSTPTFAMVTQAGGSAETPLVIPPSTASRWSEPSPMVSWAPTPANLKEVLKKSAKTLGLYPISKEVVDEFKEKLIKDGFEGNPEKRALREAAREYLQEEMKMRTSEWEQLDIVDVFTPRALDFNTVYIELSSISEADAVKSLSVHLRQGQRLCVARHVPWQARERVNALEGIAKQMRDAGNKTRIDLRDDDYQLQYKPRSDSDSLWRNYGEMDTLPPFSTKRGVMDTDRSPGEARGRKVRRGVVEGGPVSNKRKATSPLTGANKTPIGRRPSCCDSVPAAVPVVFGADVGAGEEQEGESSESDYELTVDMVSAECTEDSSDYSEASRSIKRLSAVMNLRPQRSRMPSQK